MKLKFRKNNFIYYNLVSLRRYSSNRNAFNISFSRLNKGLQKCCQWMYGTCPSTEGLLLTNTTRGCQSGQMGCAKDALA